MRAPTVGVLVGALVLGLAAGVQPATADVGWTAVPVETTAGEQTNLLAVTAPAAGDLWAVGFHREPSGHGPEEGTLAEHWNGTTFEIVPTPNRGTTPTWNVLSDVAGSSANDVWAVGVSIIDHPARTLAEHWDGAAWTIVASTNPGDGDELLGVTALATDDVWAVGWREGLIGPEPLAEHWNGSRWSTVPAPEPSACTGPGYLTAVTGSSAHSVWASGTCETGGGRPVEQGFIERWNGQVWSIVAGGKLIPPKSELSNISATSSSNVWAVGALITTNDVVVHPYATHWDGSTWTRQSFDAASSGFGLGGVSANKGDSAWAVGNGIVKFSAGSGVAVPGPGGYLDDVTHEPDGGLWAVGGSLAATTNPGAPSRSL